MSDGNRHGWDISAGASQRSRLCLLPIATHTLFDFRIDGRLKDVRRTCSGKRHGWVISAKAGQGSRLCLLPIARHTLFDFRIDGWLRNVWRTCDEKHLGWEISAGRPSEPAIFFFI